MDFEADYPDARVVRLERNYRSTQVILDAASGLIGQNRNRKEKRLYTERKGGEKIRYYRTGDELEEADTIAREARQALRSADDTPFAVLDGIDRAVPWRLALTPRGTLQWPWESLHVEALDGLGKAA